MPDSKGPVFYHFDSMNPDWALSEVSKMQKKHPPSEVSNASGKFFKNYTCWHFHKSSQWPLVVSINHLIRENRKRFSEVYRKDLAYEFIVVSIVEDANQEVCLWHKDGHFFDGQIHLTVLGNAKILVKNEGKVSEICMDNGSFWYLNGSNFLHKIKKITERRVEVCIPINQNKSDVSEKLKAVSKDEFRWVDGGNKHWLELRKKQAQYVIEAVKRKTASNLSFADFSVETNV